LFFLRSLFRLSAARGNVFFDQKQKNALLFHIKSKKIESFLKFLSTKVFSQKRYFHHFDLQTIFFSPLFCFFGHHFFERAKKKIKKNKKKWAKLEKSKNKEKNEGYSSI
jgi:predicted membrane protein